MYAEQQQNMKAFDDYEKATKLDEDCVMAHFGKANVRASLKDYIGAIVDYEMAVWLDESLT